MSGPSLENEGSKTRRFFKSLLPHWGRNNRPIHVDGLAFVPDDVKSKKILVIDDDAVIRKTLCLKLQNVGYQVVTGTDGADAIRGVREEQPDLIILDIHFPPDVSHGGGVPWDGFILMKWLSGMERGQKVPVIFITGSAAPGVREKALASGALAFFEKPIDHVRLLSLIQKAFRS
jgi:two-component system alkaline phosphatase synthesis response regulator PhoP